MSFWLPVMASHFSLAALYSDSMRSSSAFLTLRSILFWLCTSTAPELRASAAAIRVSFSFMVFSLRPAKQSRDERDEEQHDEDDEQHLGDFRRAGGDAGEAEDRRDD